MRAAMRKDLEGELTTKGEAFAIVVSRYNEMVTRPLLDGALATLKEHGVPDERVLVAWVPGAFEIPIVADRLRAAGDLQRFAAWEPSFRGRPRITSTSISRSRGRSCRRPFRAVFPF